MAGFLCKSELWGIFNWLYSHMVLPSSRVAMKPNILQLQWIAAAWKPLEEKWGSINYETQRRELSLFGLSGDFLEDSTHKFCHYLTRLGACQIPKIFSPGKIIENNKRWLKSMRQMLRAGALGRPRGMGWGGRWEGGTGWETHVNPWLIHVNVWQKSLQYYKVISLQLIKIYEK